MQVRAKEMGIYAGARKRPGVVFEIPDGAKVPPWAEAVTEDAAPQEPPKPIPTTLSEMTPKPKKRGRPPQTFREIADEGV